MGFWKNGLRLTGNSKNAKVHQQVTVAAAGEHEVQCFRIMLKPFKNLFVRS
jgi:hypothetical protein